MDAQEAPSSEIETSVGDALLMPDDAVCGEAALDLAFDEDGAPTVRRDRPGPVQPFIPCTLEALNGSWLLELTPEFFPLRLIRGPMRVEASAARFRISGDIYVRDLGNAPPNAAELQSPIAPSALLWPNWYPAFAQGQYRWYFRSQGITYSDGVLTFPFERRLWDPALQEFAGVDTGTMRLTCRQQRVALPWAPQPTIRMMGTATIGGRTFTARATKTSRHHRGCRVEVDVMRNRRWPATAVGCGGQPTFSFTASTETPGWTLSPRSTRSMSRRTRS
jgi:hypothetical protein